MIACYSRVSTTEQALNGHSINEQNERMIKYADALGLRNARIYSDGGYSGANMKRPALQSMIKDIQLGKISKVIVYKLDRLSRSQRDTLYLIEDVFLANNCDFISMNENFDTTTPFGKAMIGILSVFAQLEREQIKERMSMGKSARAKEGKWHGGVTPVGYDYKNGEIVVNEYYAMQVKEVFERFVKGEPLTSLERSFDKKGYLLPSGSKWGLKHFRNVLMNKIYIGYIRNHSEWVKASHPTIIDNQLFERATEVLKERDKRYDGQYKYQGVQTSLLGGLVYCKRCGGRYGKIIYHGMYYYYMCYSRSKKVRAMIKDPTCMNKNWRMDRLDNIILDEIRKLKTDPKRIVKKQKKTDTREILEKQVNEIENQISRLLDLYSKDMVPIEQLETKVGELSEAKNKLTAQITAQNDSYKLDRRKVIEILDSFDEVVERSNFEEKQRLVNALIDRIEIDGEDIEIHWNF